MSNATTTQILEKVKSWTMGKINSISEKLANKVTSISNASTDTQYPSAKCVYDKWKANADAIGAIEDMIPSQASSSNKLADKGFVNSSIATNTATFRGTYNLISDLSLTTSATEQQIAAALATKMSALSIVPDNNDYAFVQIPTADATPTEIARVDRYKFNGSSWALEFSLNNSGFTAAQWATLNSGLVSGDKTKLDALPTNAELTILLNGKEAVSNKVTSISGESTDTQYPSAKAVWAAITAWLSGAMSWTAAQMKQARANLGFGNGDIDDVPTAGSNNVVKSGGVQSELALGAVYDVSAKNPTAGPNNDGKWASLSALLSDANLNTLIPTSVRKGGMSIKYVQSSDNNYIQFRLMLSTFTEDQFKNTDNWINSDITSGTFENTINKTASSVGRGYVRGDTGGIGSTTTSSYGHTGYLNVQGLSAIKVVSGAGSPAGSDSSYTYMCFYDSQKQFVRNIRNVSRTKIGSKIDINEEECYVRITTSTYDGGSVTYNLYETCNAFDIKEDVEELDNRVSVLENTQKNQKYESILGENGLVVSAATFNNGDIIECNDFPRDNKGGNHYALSCNVDGQSFGSITLRIYNSAGEYFYITIDSTNVTVAKNSEANPTSTAHGLTIDKSLQFNVINTDDSTNGLGKFVIKIRTQSDTVFSWLYQTHIYAPSGITQIINSNSVITNLTFSVINQNFRKPLWIFGASYENPLDSNRWVNQMRSLGYKNYYVNQLAGRAPQPCYEDFMRALNFGCPKYFMWTMFGNGTVADWNTYSELVYNICKEKGITMLVTLRPNTSNFTDYSSRKSMVLDFVAAHDDVILLDYRYALSPNPDGTSWFDGYLSSDNVHPTSLGAKAIAFSILSQFPTIMQY